MTISPTNILIVEDEKEIRRFVRIALESEGWRVFESDTLQRGLIEAGTRKPDLIILDLGLPDGDGLTYIQDLRQWSAIPIIVLSARNSEEDKVAALDAGADDYVLKPFEMSELEARLRAVLRRAQGIHQQKLSLGNVAFETESRFATVNGKQVDLLRREAMLLEEMLRVWPRITVKERLEEHLYASRESVTLNAVEALVSRLRRKLRDGGANVQIDTVRGVGYRMVLPQEAHACA